MGSVQFGKMMGSILGVDGGLPHALNLHHIAAVSLFLTEGLAPKKGLCPTRKESRRVGWSEPHHPTLCCERLAWTCDLAVSLAGSRLLAMDCLVNQDPPRTSGRTRERFL